MDVSEAPEPPPPAPPPLSFWETVQSVAAAFFGVQSARNRERDFTRGKPLHFIIIGLALTLLLIGGLALLVRVILRSAL